MNSSPLGPARDGGFWLLGLRRPDERLLLGVPMSRPDTGTLQLARLHAAGLRVARMPELTDAGTPPDAEAVAAAALGGRSGEVMRALRARGVRA
ncbi:DUF2064 domain-containing protein [Actinomadura opuntiae]|uniref:DUF2064 domain-containing protein n=1 Tax=Actinomadura sp. OS1-43 TaxID=604315 RepID=UPI00255A8AFD|nr:DUF2064 domain-containing protein [Actinomadura sp. OS1-43]MDL4816879.1 DUF2064 domain-containing protein [Actinomadura sp. OS1-43]